MPGGNAGHQSLWNEFQFLTPHRQRWGLESLDSDSSPDLVGLGLESHTLGLGLDLRYAGLGLDSDFVEEVIKTSKEF